MAKILNKIFFNRPTIAVARNLLGKFLVRQFPRRSALARRSLGEGGSGRRKSARREAALMITEVEAYDGPNDLASHASRGRTERTKIMFGEAGRFYVYFTYGMHWLVNVVTGPENYPAAVLFRAGRTPDGKNIIGPARLTKYLKINGKFNGLTASKKTGLWLEDRGIRIKPSAIIAGKRIGVDYAGKWAHKLYDFKVEI